MAAAGADGHPVYCPQTDLRFDGLLLTGGGDIEPALFGQPPKGSNPPDRERDKAELSLCADFLAAGKPILGICRGCQILNVALGGSLVQDLGPLNQRHITRADGRDNSHPVCALPGSLLFGLFGATFWVNSAHHQAVDAPGDGLIVTARSQCGVAECVELPHRPVLGVQFHPERMAGALRRADTVDGSGIFRWFVDACT